jgi:hypothetical protein
MSRNIAGLTASRPRGDLGCAGASGKEQTMVTRTDYDRRVEEIYEELRREATYPVGSIYDLDDRDSAKQIATLERLAQERQSKPPAPTPTT